MLTRLAVVAALLFAASAGCTASDRAPERVLGSSPSAVPTWSAGTSPAPTATSTGDGGAITVTTDEVAGVPLGTAADEAERRLREVLGTPATEPLPGCYGESGRRLTWRALTAFLSDGADGGAVELSGWEVVSGAGAAAIELPYDTAVGDAVREVLARVPSSTGRVLEEGPEAGTYAVTTENADGLFWLSPDEDGVVVEASFRAESCD